MQKNNQPFIIFRFLARAVLYCILITSPITLYADVSSDQPASNDGDSSWKVNPISIHGEGNFGLLLPILLYDIGKGNTLSDQYLFTVGGKVDIGLLYVRRWLVEQFDCYPQLGFVLKHNYILSNVAETANITGGVFYLEPNYDYLSRWEMLPRIGIGLAYLNIPGGFSSVFPYQLQPDGKRKSVPYSASSLDAFREEIDLNIILGMMFKFRLTPHWHMALTLGLDYFPALLYQFKDDNLKKFTRSQKAIEIYTISLSGGYTLYPSDYTPPKRYSPYRHGNMLIHVAFFSSWRNAYLESKSSTSQQSSNKGTQKILQASDESYYLGGLQIQSSYRVKNNHAIVLGSEWMRDFALQKELENTLRTGDMQVSIMLGHEFIWGKLNFGQYVGFYLLNNLPHQKPYLYNDLGYIRLAVNYNITRYFYVGTSLKIDVLPTPRAMAISQHSSAREYTRIKYIDFRVGYTF